MSQVRTNLFWTSLTLVNATLRGDDIQGFDTRRDEVLLSIEETFHDHIPESVYNMRIRESEKLKTALVLYDQDLEHKEKLPSYARLTNMVKKIFKPEIRDRNFRGQKRRNRVWSIGQQRGHGETIKW